MGLASCRRDGDQNMYSAINALGKSLCVKSAHFLHLHMASVWLDLKQSSTQHFVLTERHIFTHYSCFNHYTIHGVNSCFYKRLSLLVWSIKNISATTAPLLANVLMWVSCAAVSLYVWQAVYFLLETSGFCQRFIFRECDWVLWEQCQLVLEISQSFWAHKVSNNQQGLGVHTLLYGLSPACRLSHKSEFTVYFLMLLLFPQHYADKCCFWVRHQQSNSFQISVCVVSRSVKAGDVNVRLQYEALVVDWN